MTQPTAIATPCIRVCCVDPGTGWCEGCFRTLREIATWGRLTAEERAAVMAELPERKSAATAGSRA